jgi:hypothetical protein
VNLDPDAVTPPRPLESASSIYVSGEEVRSHSYTRPGEALEIVPGLLVTQHSGEGKANQYQLRGFQLDHGTDLAIFYDGMPLNMPTHGHGQGYADANFLIPELFDTILAHKGPYFAEEGDFSAAGAVHINLIDSLPNGGTFSLIGGSYDYAGAMAMTSSKLADGNLLTAAQVGYYNGPWTIGDGMHKINGVIRWARGTQENGLSITAMAYANDWHATNQIPERGVTEGVIPLFGTIDPTDRGDTTRFSLSTRWSETDANSHSRIEAFVAHTTLDLYNNFDYFLTQPILGDQFRQFDRRTTMGITAEHDARRLAIALRQHSRRLAGHHADGGLRDRRERSGRARQCRRLDRHHREMDPLAAHDDGHSLRLLRRGRRRFSEPGRGADGRALRHAGRAADLDRPVEFRP